MGYVICYESLRDMYNQISLVMDSIMNECIPKINEVLLEYINEEKIQWKTADKIKRYLGETYGTILQGIYDVSQQLLINFRLYANAAKAGKVLTSIQKAKIVVSELGKEVIGTGGGFLGLKLGEGLGLSKEESMFLGMAVSIVTSKGADQIHYSMNFHQKFT